MIKTLLATSGAVLMAVSVLQAAPGGSFGADHGGSFGGARSSGVGPRAQGRSGAGLSGARARYGYRGGYGRGRRYYLSGVPYFYDPFFFGFGYYGGFYGDSYGYGPYGDNVGYANGTYNGQVVDDRNRNGGDNMDPTALPKEVQRQLSKRGYYKGSIDGEFGPGSKSALTRFQRDNNLRSTGRVDAPTLKALGFDDRDNSERN